MQMAIYDLHGALFLIHASYCVILLLIYQSVLSTVSRILYFIQIINKILFFLLQIFPNFVWWSLIIRLLQQDLLIIDRRNIVDMIIQATIPTLTRLHWLLGILPRLCHIIVVCEVSSTIDPIPTNEQGISLSSLIQTLWVWGLLLVLPTTIYLY